MSVSHPNINSQNPSEVEHDDSMIKPLFEKENWGDQHNQNSGIETGNQCQCQFQCQEQGQYMGDTKISFKSKFKQDSIENMKWMILEGATTTNQDHRSSKNSKTMLKISPAMHSIAIPNLSMSDLKILSRVEAGVSNSNPTLKVGKISSLGLSLGKGQGQDSGQTFCRNCSINVQSQNQIQNHNCISNFPESSKSEFEFNIQMNVTKPESIVRSSDLLLSKFNSFESFGTGYDSHKKDTLGKGLSTKSSISSQYLSFSSSGSGSSSGSVCGFGCDETFFDAKLSNSKESQSHCRKLQRSCSVQCQREWPASSCRTQGSKKCLNLNNSNSNTDYRPRN